MKPGVDALQSLPLLATCTPAMLTRLNAVSDLARLGANEVLFRQGDQVNELNILTAGYAVTTQSQPDGNDGVIDVVEPITPIGQPTALLGGASPIGSRTVTSARVIVIEAAELMAMIRKFPPLALSFLDQALWSVKDQTLENARLKLRTTTQRLAHYLLRLTKKSDVSPARFVLPFEKRLVASKIGCVPANLSRSFNELRSVGVIVRDKVVVVRSVSALREYAGATDI
jgi:CRP/FNR family transcriptional activator FtrB